MKRYLLFSLLALTSLLPLLAQNNGGNVKLINSSKLPEVYPMTDIEDITFDRDVLDVPPLEQVTLDDLSRLMGEAYPQESPAMMCELGSDNFVDNNVYLMYLIATEFKSSSGLYDQLFTWSSVSDDASYATNADSPLAVWYAYMGGISICDYILRAADAIETAQPSQSESLQPYRAEALLVRAWLRSALADVFDVDFETAIDEDLLAGLQLIDYLQDEDAYRLTRRAANALAARHYLMKRDWAKVEQYATAALGDNPADMLRDWQALADCTNIGEKLDVYYDATLPCNFLVQNTYSLRSRMLVACRYATNGEPLKVVLWGGNGPVWKSCLPSMNGNVYIWGRQEYGAWLFRAYEYFEYTDEEAGIGYVINKYTPFTAEETLLMRAEARFYLGWQDACLEDLNIWVKSKMVTNELTLDNIEAFYTPDKSGLVNDVHIDEMGWSQQDIQTAAQDKPLLDCLLHFRRIETIYDGLRWNDLKRYGINIQHEARQPYAITKTYSAKYQYDVPGSPDATAPFRVLLHMKDGSVVAANPQQILFGGDDAADERAKESFVATENGWVLQTFDLTGNDSGIVYYGNDECRIVGEGLMALGKDVEISGESQINKGLYRILEEKPGEEYLLQGMADDSNYPYAYRLVACSVPWETYHEQCEQTRRDLWITDMLRCGDFYIKKRQESNMIAIGHTADFAETTALCPFIYTPTGIRLAGADVLPCEPEFVLDIENNTLTSTDGQMTFGLDIDSYLETLLSTTNSRYEITYEETNTELASAVEALSTALPSYSNCSIKDLFLGNSTDRNAKRGIGVTFYTNTAHTKTNNFGIAASFSCRDRHLFISVPGLAGGTPEMSVNAETLSNRSGDIYAAILGLLHVMEGEYTYSAEGVRTGYVAQQTYDEDGYPISEDIRTLTGVRITKVGNPEFSFAITIE